MCLNFHHTADTFGSFTVDLQILPMEGAAVKIMEEGNAQFLKKYYLQVCSRLASQPLV